jgi:hypothetical protein
VHHAVTNQIADNLSGHVLAEMATGALGCAVLFGAFSAVCDSLKGSA